VEPGTWSRCVIYHSVKSISLDRVPAPRDLRKGSDAGFLSASSMQSTIGNAEKSQITIRSREEITEFDGSEGQKGIGRYSLLMDCIIYRASSEG
ncbi:Chromosome segregation ATPase, partial [Giardia duodenalis]